MADTVPDRIEKQILLRAPRSRVWRALTDAGEFSQWFRLEEVPGGTLLKVAESGFSQLPAARRGPAHEANSGGWDKELRNIERHVAEHPSPGA